MIYPEVEWSNLRARHEQLVQQLSSPALDPATRQSSQKEVARLGELLRAHDKATVLESERDEVVKQLGASSDPEFQALYQEELADLNKRLALSVDELEGVLYPPDERDNNSVFLEIRAGTGGQEAALFAADLMRMYTLYAVKKGWKTSVLSESETDLKGYREVVFSIEGRGVFGHLKHESGVHRVQRVPKTEAAGRIHTSTATVAVMPEAEEVDFTINPEDLRIDVYRAGGAGGQHVNKTESAVRITHIPTGIVVACQDERSQHKNKAKALKAIQARLSAYQGEKAASEQSQMRREQVGTGERAEKVRTYNYPQNRVTDHQVELTLNKLDRVMEGDLDEIIEALMRKEREARKQRHV
ncbi:TPA: peptide chain release factor 1 [Candidatus Dependentiae bacterium]|nr:MAG: Peptide chain release factor 1 [candidate division TM6 bacterium GW2011_GWF2_43_87]HBL98808.1 peptide chain release factor 1 [Candidatus Dependentiae bacterium]